MNYPSIDNLPPEFLSKLRNLYPREVLYLYRVTMKKKQCSFKQGLSDHWRTYFQLTPQYIKAIETEVTEDPNLLQAIEIDPALSAGQRNYLRSAKRRVLVLCFIVALLYVHWRDKKDDKPKLLLCKYLEIVGTGTPVEAALLVRQQNQLIKELRGRIRALEQIVSNQAAELMVNSNRDLVVIKRVAAAPKKPSKRSKTNIPS